MASPDLSHLLKASLRVRSRGFMFNMEWGGGRSCDSSSTGQRDVSPRGRPHTAASRPSAATTPPAGSGDSEAALAPGGPFYKGGDGRLQGLDEAQTRASVTRT